MSEQVQQWLQWLTKDPTGRIVGIAAVSVLGVIALVVLFRTTRWAFARKKAFIGGALAVALLYYAAVYVLNLGPLGWGVGLLIAFACFVAFALYMTRAS
jgi:hypothetical protein